MTQPTEQEIFEMEERINQILRRAEHTVDDDINAFRAKMARDDEEAKAFNERAEEFKRQLDREVFGMMLFSVISLGIAVVSVGIPAVKYFRYRNR